MGRKPNNTISNPNVTFTSLLDMLPEQMREVLKKLTPAKVAKLRAEVQSKLDQAQYLNNVIDSVLKESSPEYYAAISQQGKPSNNTVPSWQSTYVNNNAGVGVHPFSQLQPEVDPGQGYSFDGPPLPLDTIPDVKKVDY